MSLIHTCQLCGANPFDYLTELQRHIPGTSGEPRQSGCRGTSARRSAHANTDPNFRAHNEARHVAAFMADGTGFQARKVWLQSEIRHSVV